MTTELKQTFCSIITIGDELLIGQTIDTNSAWIAQQLNPIGIPVKRRIAVGDNKQEILDALERERNDSDIIIITGGLGPTSDDITKPVLCEYFNSGLIENAAVLKHIMSYFDKRNRPMLQSNLMQAMVPEVCEVLFNEEGTAPGMLFKEKGQVIISLPGVPNEMQYIISTHVLSYLQANFKTPNFIHRTLVTSGEGESFIAERLKDFEATLPPEIKLAYLPKINIVKLRLTATDIEEGILETHFHRLKEILHNITIIDADLELEFVLGQLLVRNQKTISVAESCTGGSIASRITSIKGSSAYFKGGIVPYSIESKQNVLEVSKDTIDRFGVVSEETVIEMAQKCREKFKSDFALSVSGYLEKKDHDNSVWIGLNSSSTKLTKKIIAPYDREKNTILVANAALNLLRLFILKQLSASS
ncbi:MAG: CinA family nicotinamide mononucleotide deamidase-related protein [Bacteroidetes bacterium]|nr:CinA family nicotinamide mononucleotide deamidase-related protein [Bacteroidota bacterium]